MVASKKWTKEILLYTYFNNLSDFESKMWFRCDSLCHTLVDLLPQLREVYSSGTPDESTNQLQPPSPSSEYLYFRNG